MKERKTGVGNGSSWGELECFDLHFSFRGLLEELNLSLIPTDVKELDCGYLAISV